MRGTIRSPLLLLLLLGLGSSPPSRVSALRTRGSARVLDSVKTGEAASLNAAAAAAAAAAAGRDAAGEEQNVSIKEVAQAIEKITEGVTVLWRKAKELLFGSETKQSEAASMETSAEEETEETATTRSTLHSTVGALTLGAPRTYVDASACMHAHTHEEGRMAELPSISFLPSGLCPLSKQRLKRRQKKNALTRGSRPPRAAAPAWAWQARSPPMLLELGVRPSSSGLF
ncbi:hypothetical protein ACSSS7_006060 [Eimeria intestinalis]